MKILELLKYCTGKSESHIIYDLLTKFNMSPENIDSVKDELNFLTESNKIVKYNKPLFEESFYRLNEEIF